MVGHSRLLAKSLSTLCGAGEFLLQRWAGGGGEYGLGLLLFLLPRSSAVNGAASECTAPQPRSLPVPNFWPADQ